MMTKKRLLSAASCLALCATVALVVARCGDDAATGTSTYNYVATTTEGDLVSYTVNGNTVNVNWKVTTANTGAINKTYTVALTCGAADATYAYKTCEINSASCTEGPGAGPNCGTSDPVVGDDMYLLEIPGFALIIGREGVDEIQAGFVPGACGSFSTGDYLYTKLNPGNSTSFGLFRVSTNSLNGPFPGPSSFLTHGDFSIVSTTPNDPMVVQTTKLDYSDTDGKFVPDSVTCENGVYTIVAGGGATSLRAVVTASGLLMMDLPSGDGGQLAFNVAKKASLADLANKTFVGLAFPDNDHPTVGAATTGPSNGTRVEITNFSSLGSPPQPNPGQFFYPASALDGTVANLKLDLTTVPANSGGGEQWSTNALQGTYPTPSTIPGLFGISAATNPADDGRIMTGAFKHDGKVVLFGAVYNDRGNPSLLPNTGAFLFIEK